MSFCPAHCARTSAHCASLWPPSCTLAGSTAALTPNSDLKANLLLLHSLTLQSLPAGVSCTCAAYNALLVRTLFTIGDAVSLIGGILMKRYDKRQARDHRKDA